jgi:hypothetical protein
MALLNTSETQLSDSFVHTLFIKRCRKPVQFREHLWRIKILGWDSICPRYKRHIKFAARWATRAAHVQRRLRSAVAWRSARRLKIKSGRCGRSGARWRWALRSEGGRGEAVFYIGPTMASLGPAAGDSAALVCRRRKEIGLPQLRMLS